MIVHNNLTCDNVYLVFQGKNKCDIKISGFDSSSFSIESKRFAVSGSTKKYFSNKYDIETLFTDVKSHLNKINEKDRSVITSTMNDILSSSDFFKTEIQF